MSASKVVYLKGKINNLKTSVKLIYWLEEPVLLFGHYEFNISELFFFMWKRCIEYKIYLHILL